MKLINQSLYFLCFLLISLSPVSAKEDFRIEDQPLAFEEALSLPCYGTLKQKENGFIYLDASNAYITKIIPLLEIPGELRPRPTASKSIGAHISVFHENEGIRPEELEQPFSFQVQDIRSFTLNTRDGLKKLWVIAADSPELEALRVSYGCSPKLKGYDYHITLGKQMPSAPEGWQERTEFSRLDLSNEPTEELYSDGDFVKVDCPQIIETARRVNQIGQLCLKSNGFVYVDVDNRFVTEIVDQLPLEGSFAPVSTKPKGMGAHISVVYEDEMIHHEIWDLPEAGEWFSFEVKELRCIDRSTPSGVNRLWVLAVDAPGLQRLRTAYGMKPKLKGHDFHITIGHEKIETAIQKKAA